MVNVVKPVLKQANEVKQTNNQTGDMQPSQAARLIPSEPTIMVTSPVGIRLRFRFQDVRWWGGFQAVTFRSQDVRWSSVSDIYFQISGCELKCQLFPVGEVCLAQSIVSCCHGNNWHKVSEGWTWPWLYALVNHQRPCSHRLQVFNKKYKSWERFKVGPSYQNLSKSKILLNFSILQLFLDLYFRRSGGGGAGGGL